MAQFTKRDLNLKPSLEDLARTYAALLPYFEQSGFNFKIIGGYACNLLGSNRDTKDLDFVFDLNSLESVRDLMISLNIPNLHPLGAGAGFGYLLSPSNLVEVDVLDRRLFNTLKLVPDSIWKNEDPIVPIEWMLFVKLRTWESRSERVAPIRAGGRNPAMTDSIDVANLAKLAADSKVTIPSFVISKTMEITTKFTEQNPASKDYFETLGFSVFTQETGWYGDQEDGDQEDGDQEDGDHEDEDQEDGDQEDEDQEDGDQEDGDQEDGDHEDEDQEDGDQEDEDQEDGDQEDGVPEDMGN